MSLLSELGLSDCQMYLQPSAKRCTDAQGRHAIYDRDANGFWHLRSADRGYNGPYDFSKENQAWRDFDGVKVDDFTKVDQAWHEHDNPILPPQQTWSEIYGKTWSEFDRSGTMSPVLVKPAQPNACPDGKVLIRMKKGKPVCKSLDKRKNRRMAELSGMGDMMDELFPTGLFSFGMVNATSIEASRRRRTTCPRGMTRVGARCVRYISSFNQNRGGGGGGD